jgi:LacI family transcriptional regulator
MLDRTPATLSDVARRAAVSVSTASKALNGKGDVNAVTRARVQAAAADLGFTPNTLARGLIGGKTGTVGIITSDLEGRFAIPILLGAEDALGAGQISAFLCDARGDSIREKQHVSALLARRIDGLIIVGAQTDERPSLGKDLPVPVVYAYSMSDDTQDISVSPDNEQAGQLAAEHLIAVGRTRIGHISGEAQHAAAQKRLAGMTKALDTAGLKMAGRPLFGDWSEGWGRAAAAMLLDSTPEIDAILCGSDQIARGVLDALRERGVAVPQDIAIIGIDNWKVLSENSRPALTTVDLNLERLGRLAAQRLFAALNGAEQGRGGTEYLPCSLVIRDSTIPRG